MRCLRPLPRVPLGAGKIPVLPKSLIILTIILTIILIMIFTVNALADVCDAVGHVACVTRGS